MTWDPRSWALDLRQRLAGRRWEPGVKQAQLGDQWLLPSRQLHSEIGLGNPPRPHDISLHFPPDFASLFTLNSTPTLQSSHLVCGHLSHNVWILSAADFDLLFGLFHFSPQVGHLRSGVLVRY